LNQSSHDRFDDRFDARFHETRNEGIQMRGASQDQALFGFFDVIDGNGFRRRNGHSVDDFIPKRVDQPRLTSGQFNGARHGFWRKSLTRFGGVLGIQSLHLCGVEIAQLEGSDLDIKWTGRTKPRRITTTCGLVIAHVA